MAIKSKKALKTRSRAKTL